MQLRDDEQEEMLPPPAPPRPHRAGPEATGTDTPPDGAGGRTRPKRRYSGGQRGFRWAAYNTAPELTIHHSNVRAKPDDTCPPRA